MSKKRRTPEEVMQAVAKAREFIAKGDRVGVAIKKANVTESVWHNYKNKTIVTKPGLHGVVDVRSLPPRPKKKKGGYRTPKPVDMNDVGSVAQRIARLDRKLRDIDGMVKERIELVAVLIKLLKVKHG